MRRTTLVGLSCACILPICSVANAAVAAPQKPNSGRYSGDAAYSSGPVPVTFTVNHNRTKVLRFSSDAEVKPGCKAPNSSFDTPVTTKKKISRSGRFKQSYDAYTDSSGKPYHVTVTEHFTTRTKVVGKFVLVSKKYPHCDQSVTWSAADSG